MHIRFSGDARADLHAIKSYIESLNPRAADRVMVSIFTTIEQLERFPFLGRPGRIDGTRELAISRYPYIVVYTLPDEYHVDIERVLHAAIKYPAQE